MKSREAEVIMRRTWAENRTAQERVEEKTRKGGKEGGAWTN
jgi:hypothetical protein